MTLQNMIICLFTLILVVCCATSVPSTAAPAEETFSLTVTIKSRHIDHFEFCIPIRVDEPVQIVWSGVIHNLDEGDPEIVYFQAAPVRIDHYEQTTVLRRAVLLLVHR
jgi:hypothetical protein